MGNILPAAGQHETGTLEVVNEITIDTAGQHEAGTLAGVNETTIDTAGQHETGTLAGVNETTIDTAGQHKTDTLAVANENTIAIAGQNKTGTLAVVNENTIANAGQHGNGTTKVVVVAIDFGTTYSGYAFSFRHKPLQICTNKAWAPGTDRLMSLKTPTCVLLKPDKEFHSFGYEAENKYAELAEDDQHVGWYFFRSFKMMLYNTTGITERTMIRDMEGKQLPAVDIYAHSIRYLKDHFKKELKNQTGDTFDSLIQYVLTVPAIWDDKAKIFMRKAAVKAGIPSELLRLALEPEAASLWCQVHAKERHVNICKMFLVVDLGGGTADIAIQEINENGTLKEVHKATGGAWGGTIVDDKFENLLSKIVGKDVLEKLKVVDMDAYLSIARSFETQKRNFKSNERMTVRIPVALFDILQEEGRDISNHLEESGLTGQCIVKRGKLTVDPLLVRGLFQEPINSLIRHLKVLLRESKVGDVGTIVLVGGFSESPIVQEAIGEAFPDENIIIPSDCGLAVLKGAVRFGHSRMLIAARKSRFAYGISTKTTFDPSKHPENKRVVQYGQNFCDKIFEEIVSMGEDLPYGKEFSFRGHAIDVRQKHAICKLRASNHTDTKFTDEEGCVEIGHIRIDFSHLDNVDDMTSTTYFSFWDTEIKFRVEVNKSDKVIEKVFDQL